MIKLKTNKQTILLESNINMTVKLDISDKFILCEGKPSNNICLLSINKDNIILTYNNIGMPLNKYKIKEELEKWNNLFNSKVQDNIEQIIFNNKRHINDYSIGNIIIYNSESNNTVKKLKIRNTFIIRKNCIIINGDKIEYPFNITNKEVMSSIVLNNVVSLDKRLIAKYIFKDKNDKIQIGMLCDPKLIIKFIDKIKFFDKLDSFMIVDNIDTYIKLGG